MSKENKQPDARLACPAAKELMADIVGRIKLLKQEHGIITFKGDEDPIIFYPQE